LSADSAARASLLVLLPGCDTCRRANFDHGEFAAGVRVQPTLGIDAMTIEWVLFAQIVLVNSHWLDGYEGKSKAWGGVDQVVLAFWKQKCVCVHVVHVGCSNQHSASGLLISIDLSLMHHF
jgi:hypothetical protein